VGRSAVLSLSGEVDDVGAAEREHIVATLLRHRTLHLDVDLERVTFIGSRGLTAILEAHAVVARHGGAVHLRASSRCASRLLEVAGVRTLFDGTGSAGAPG